MKIGKFTIIGQLGTGAHSTILHVRRDEDAASYALKIVPIDSAEELKFKIQAEHEFRVAQMLDHPNLIKIYALEPMKDWLFRVKKLHMLIQYVPGKTLDEAPRLSIPRIVQVFAQVAAGIAQMHEKDVFHSDLKPNNIMLGQDSVVRVIDYGLARLRDEPKVRLQGTPEYMAPEQAKHYMVNERTDIYSFGAAMYRMITSRLPPPTLNEEDKPVELKHWLKNFKPVESVISATPKPLAELVNRCLSFQATTRPESMVEIEKTLTSIAMALVTNPDDGLEGLEW